MFDATRDDFGARAREQLGEAMEHAAQAAEAPAVAAATGFMTPFAMMAEADMFLRKSRGLAMRWGADLAKCRSPHEMIDVNARYGERAMAMGYSEMWRVLERSALWGRACAAPRSLALRDRNR